MPNKRPYHTIIPSMLTYGQDNTLLGVMGAMVIAPHAVVYYDCAQAVCISVLSCCAPFGLFYIC
jgi:hypothetical protein